MANRLLSKEEVEKIVSQAKAKGNTHPRPFLTSNAATIAEAVKNNQSYVIIQGRRFSIKHTPHFGGSVVINPDVGFAPCGYITDRTLKQALEDSNAL